MVAEFIPIVLFLCVAAVLILRPLTKRLGTVLEQLARDRATPTALPAADVAALRATLDHMVRRLDLIEERLDFTERLVASRPVSAAALAADATAAELRLRRPG